MLRAPEGELPASGRTLELRSCDFIKVRDWEDRLVARVFDNMAFLGQLGLAEQPAVS